MMPHLAGWELLALARQLDEVLDLLAIAPAPPGAAWTPPLDLIELPDRYIVRIDVPGVPRADLRVTVARSRLRVSGRRTVHRARPGTLHCHRAERNHGGFYLEIRLPSSTAGELATAVLRAGVLVITLPRRNEPNQPLTVPITEEEP